MVVAHTVQEIGFQPETIVTLGTFDGVHAGHSSIMTELARIAKKRNYRSVVMTFDPHPRTVVGRGPVQLLTTLTERLALLEQLDVDAALVLEFTYDFSRQSAREFYKQYVVEGTGAREVLIGHDHMFGRDRKAGIEELRLLGREFGFDTTVIEPVTIDNEIVNSSRIRALLTGGDVERASRFLQRPYTLSGTVIHGDGRGKQIGFPTANIDVDHKEKIIPAHGVYVVMVDVEGRKYSGMMNIGIRPTFHKTEQRVLEIHLLDCNDDLYNKQMTIHFVKRLRAEKKFESVDALIAQLQRDRADTINHVSAFHTH